MADTSAQEMTPTPVKVKPEAVPVMCEGTSPAIAARSEWKNYAKEFIVVGLCYVVVVGVVLLIPPLRHKLRHFLIHFLGGRLPLACSVCLGTAIAMMNGFFQQLFLDLEIAGRRRMLFVAFLILTLVVLGGASSYLQDEERNTQARTDVQNTLASIQATLNTITGGDSFPVVTAIVPLENQIQFAISDHGQYPLYDVELMMLDVEEFAQIRKDLKLTPFEKKHGKMFTHQMSEKIRRFNIGNLHDATPFRTTLAYTVGKDLNQFETLFIVDARNGMVKECLSLARTKRTEPNFGWMQAYRVTGHGSKKLAEVVPDQFPKRGNGRVFSKDCD